MTGRKDSAGADAAGPGGAVTAAVMERPSDGDLAAVFQKGRPEALALAYERYGALVTLGGTRTGAGKITRSEHRYCCS
jgi:hypothetical protein